MIPSIDFFQILSKVARLASLISLTCLLLAASPVAAFGADDLLPPQFNDLKLGVSSAQITEKMKDFGTPERTPLKRPNRFKLSWPLKNNRYFKTAEFEFTAKDHLYLVRFVLQSAYRFKTKDLKKRMFPRFGVSWDYPGKLRSKEKDIMLYIPLPGNKAPFFFEMTDTITGEKWFELFDKEQSARDRLQVKAEAAKKKAVEETKVDGSEAEKETDGAPPKEAKPAREEPAGSEAK